MWYACGPARERGEPTRRSGRQHRAGLVAPTGFAHRILTLTGRLSQRSRTVPMPHPADPSSSAAVESHGAADVLRAGGEVGRDLLAVDWAATAVGPLAGWPQSLVTVVRILLTSRFAMWMAWGPELTFFCNDAYRADTLGEKYPWALGRPAREVWAEIWPDIGPRIDAVLRDRARRPGTRRCCCSSSAAATPRRPTTRSPTARCPTTTARSPGCCASSARTPSASSASGAWRRCATSARDSRDGPDRGRGARRRRPAPRRQTALACRSRWSTCSTTTGDGAARGRVRDPAGERAAPGRPRRSATRRGVAGRRRSPPARACCST